MSGRHHREHDMNRRLDKRLRHWLGLELSGASPAEAESALGQLWRAVPDLGPAPGFAARVLLAVGLRPATGGHRFFAHWAARLAIAAGLALGGFAVAVLVPALVALLLRADLGALVIAGVGLLKALVAWIGGGLAVWNVLADVGRALGRAALTPQLLLPLATATLVAVLAFRLLLSQLSPAWFSRSLFDADSAML